MKKFALISLATVLGFAVSQNNPNKEASNFLPTVSSSWNLETAVPLLSAGSEPLIGGGLHDIIRAQSLQTLQRWALTAEAHKQKMTGEKLIGGLHDRLNSLTKEEFENYILDMAQNYPELNSSAKLDQLSIAYGVAPRKGLQIGGLHDFIFRESHETLKRWALTVEAHHQKVAGDKLIGGLHDWREPVSNEQYANYILDMTKLYPGLNSRSELEKLSALYGFSDAKVSKKIGGEGKGGLHDYLFRQPRETLVRWALTAEEYFKQKTGEKLIGGLHDRLQSSSNQDFAQYIMDMAKKFPELDSGIELDRLSQVYGFADNPTLSKSIGGLHDYIFRTDRNTLIRWALTAEAYERKIKNEEMIIGGLHDYIGKLSNQEIAEYVLRMADSHQELNSADALNSYAKTYGIEHEGGSDMKILAFLA